MWIHVKSAVSLIVHCWIGALSWWWAQPQSISIWSRDEPKLPSTLHLCIDSCWTRFIGPIQGYIQATKDTPLALFYPIVAVMEGLSRASVCQGFEANLTKFYN